jgi:transcriptional regulator with XRE-family HTH domain
MDKRSYARFGRVLRNMREQKKATMGELARHLGVSVSYLSDVERGFRPPLVDEKIMRTATFLEVQPDGLLREAAEARGAFQLDAARVTPSARHVGAMLARQWAEMSPEKLNRIQKVLEDNGEEGGDDPGI